MSDGVPERLRNILADIFAVPACQITADLAAGSIPTWNSVGHLQMIRAIELEYGVQFDPAQTHALSTVALLQQELKARGVPIGYLDPIAEHNRFYATEDRKTQPKEYFKFLTSLADPLLTPGARVLDIGCATGEFLYYLESVYPGLHMTGMDIDEEFLDKAHKSVPKARFVQGNIQTNEGLPDTRFDVVFMAGVNYLFADPAPWLKNIVELTEGTAYVFGIFNPEDLDVRMMVSRSGSAEVQPWNLISQKSISCHLGDISHRFIPWNMPIHNPRLHEDPLRSWTIPSDGSYLIVNGMQMIQRFAALEITREFST